MSKPYYSILTNIGENLVAKATALGTKLDLTTMAVGDGNGKLPAPDPSQTMLINEKRRAAVNSLEIDKNNPNIIIVEHIIPETEGGWYVREIGLFDSEDNLIAVGNCPETYKPKMIEGSGRTQIIRMMIVVKSTECIELKSDPSVVLATREYVDNELDKAKESSDSKLKNELSQSTGAGMINTESGKTVQEEIKSIKSNNNDAINQINKSQILPSFIENGGQVFVLRTEIENPLNQFVGICLAGDSITWGLSASSFAKSEPRNHALTDARNNSTSPSWANLFHKYLGERFFKKPTYTEANWPGSPSGVCEFTYKERINLYPFYTPFVRTNGWSDIIKTGSLLNRVVESTTLNSEISFEFTGYEFDVIFSSLDNSGTLSVYSNDMLIDTVDTSAATNGGVKFQNKHTISLPVFSSKTNIRLVFTDGAWMRLEGIVVPKTIRVTNQGLIGTNSDEWFDTIRLAVRGDDKFCFIQLGTNDRGGASSARASNAISNNAQGLIEYLRAKNIYPILMCANNVTQTSNFYYHMQHISSALSLKSKEILVDFINNLPVTTITRSYVNTVVNDGLHPSDSGHYMIFMNIINAIENASSTIKARNVYAKKAGMLKVGSSDFSLKLPLLSSSSVILSHKIRVNGGNWTTTFGDVEKGVKSPDGKILMALKRIINTASETDNVLLVAYNATNEEVHVNVEFNVSESLL